MPRLLNVPNSLTLLRIFLVPFLVVVLLTKFEGKEIWGVAIFLVAAATDMLDGWLARRRGQVTSLGILLDPIADKLLTSAAFISLVQVQPDIVTAWMVVVIVGREFAMSDLRSVASTRGILIAASTWGKFKMGSQVIAITLLIIGEKIEDLTGRRGLVIVGQVALWVVVVLAIISLLDYLSKARGIFARSPDAE
ncbi:MAG: CDP-diacylglycerol--glycerol-3-phosphate 3-phosphatidyltransferase [Acidobacteria bacterium]|nr:CDP-diacylglycerol--glycerol-3-phosphate 3-phosphatidyltransferase [Acidobacteriota bacterium]